VLWRAVRCCAVQCGAIGLAAHRSFHKGVPGRHERSSVLFPVFSFLWFLAGVRVRFRLLLRSVLSAPPGAELAIFLGLLGGVDNRRVLGKKKNSGVFFVVAFDVFDRWRALVVPRKRQERARNFHHRVGVLVTSTDHDGVGRADVGGGIGSSVGVGVDWRHFRDFLVAFRLFVSIDLIDLFVCLFGFDRLCFGLLGIVFCVFVCVCVFVCLCVCVFVCLCVCVFLCL